MKKEYKTITADFLIVLLICTLYYYALAETIVSTQESVWIRLNEKNNESLNVSYTALIKLNGKKGGSIVISDINSDRDRIIKDDLILKMIIIGNIVPMNFYAMDNEVKTLKINNYENTVWGSSYEIFIPAQKNKDYEVKINLNTSNYNPNGLNQFRFSNGKFRAEIELNDYFCSDYCFNNNEINYMENSNTIYSGDYKTDKSSFYLSLKKKFLGLKHTKEEVFFIILISALVLVFDILKIMINLSIPCITKKKKAVHRKNKKSTKMLLCCW